MDYPARRELRSRVFVAWMNSHLKDPRVWVYDLSIMDGLVLTRLLEALAPGRMKERQYDCMSRRKLLNIAWEFITTEEKIPLLTFTGFCIDPNDIVKSKLDQILALIWSLIVHYRINPVNTPSTEKEDEHSTQQPFSGKEFLLEWMNRKLPDANISNFTTDWSDGTKLSALVNSYSPGLISSDTSINPIKTIRKAMNLATEHFGIPQVIRPEDLGVESPDEVCVMTYLSYFCQLDKCPKPKKSSFFTWVPLILANEAEESAN